MSSYYSPYVIKAARCWARGYTPRDEAETRARNGLTAALGKFPDDIVDMFYKLYSSRHPLARAVTEYSLRYGMVEARIWHLIRDFEKQVAKECGIL